MSLKRRRALTLSFALVSVMALAVGADAFQGGRFDFKLRSADGGEITSEMVKGDVVVLGFGSTSLGSLSKTQAQQLQELADQPDKQDVRVYWVSTDSDSPKSKNYATDDQLRAFARKAGLKVAVLRDPDGVLFKRTGADQLPAIVILDRGGEISGSPIAGFDPNRKLVDVLSDRLTKLLAAK
ncbi:MAG TPA: TlpA disulfide reductase family protein [Pyrinomonadaceae bacterium]|jgi:peroxiredoxin|nr:TlpA disulfide reductase family protein [Pyrinomonadaceae bacterium]